LRQETITINVLNEDLEERIRELVKKGMAKSEISKHAKLSSSMVGMLLIRTYPFYSPTIEKRLYQAVEDIEDQMKKDFMKILNIQKTHKEKGVRMWWTLKKRGIDQKNCDHILEETEKPIWS
jgi:hypothetical protein